MSYPYSRSLLVRVLLLWITKFVIFFHSHIIPCVSSYCSIQVYRNLLTDSRNEYFSPIFYFFLYVSVEVNINFSTFGDLSMHTVIYNPTFQICANI